MELDDILSYSICVLLLSLLNYILLVVEIRGEEIGKEKRFELWIK